MENQKLLALQAQLLKEQQKTERMRILITFTGFYQEFFNILKSCRTREEAFDKLNDEYYELFGLFKYKDYQSFKKVVSYHLKKS